MKKRMLFLIVFIMVFCGISHNKAYASDPADLMDNYYLSIGDNIYYYEDDRPYVQTLKTNFTGAGYSFDASKNELTLKGYTGGVIRFDGKGKYNKNVPELTIRIAAGTNNTIRLGKNNFASSIYNYYGIYTAGNLKIVSDDANATLTIAGEQTEASHCDICIRAVGDVTVAKQCNLFFDIATKADGISLIISSKNININGKISGQVLVDRTGFGYHSWLYISGLSGNEINITNDVNFDLTVKGAKPFTYPSYLGSDYRMESVGAILAYSNITISGNAKVTSSMNFVNCVSDSSVDKALIRSVYSDANVILKNNAELVCDIEGYDYADGIVCKKLTLDDNSAVHSYSESSAFYGNGISVNGTGYLEFYEGMFDSAGCISGVVSGSNKSMYNEYGSPNMSYYYMYSKSSNKLGDFDLIVDRSPKPNMMFDDINLSTNKDIEVVDVIYYPRDTEGEFTNYFVPNTSYRAIVWVKAKNPKDVIASDACLNYNGMKISQMNGVNSGKLTAFDIVDFYIHHTCITGSVEIDETHHHYVCKICGERFDSRAHSFTRNTVASGVEIGCLYCDYTGFESNGKHQLKSIKLDTGFLVVGEKLPAPKLAEDLKPYYFSLTTRWKEVLDINSSSYSYVSPGTTIKSGCYYILEVEFLANSSAYIDSKTNFSNNGQGTLVSGKTVRTDNKKITSEIKYVPVSISSCTVNLPPVYVGMTYNELANQISTAINNIEFNEGPTGKKYAFYMLKRIDSLDNYDKVINQMTFYGDKKDFEFENCSLDTRIEDNAIYVLSGGIMDLRGGTPFFVPANGIKFQNANFVNTFMQNDDSMGFLVYGVVYNTAIKPVFYTKTSSISYKVKGTLLAVGEERPYYSRPTIEPLNASQVVSYKSSNPSVVSVNSRGDIKVLKYSPEDVIITATTVDGTNLSASYFVRTRFADVNGSSVSTFENYQYYYSAVYWAATHNPAITKGYDSGEYAGKFGVGLECTREDFATFLYRLAGTPTKYKNGKTINASDIDNVFSDANLLSSTSVKKKAIAWAYDKGIIKGYTSGANAGKFGVGVSLDRRSAMIMIWRYAGKPSAPKLSGTSAFTDVVGMYATTTDSYKAIAWASSKKITNGLGATQAAAAGLKTPCFGCDLPCTREQMITFLWRYNNL